MGFFSFLTKLFKVVGTIIKWIKVAIAVALIVLTVWLAPMLTGVVIAKLLTMAGLLIGSALGPRWLQTAIAVALTAVGIYLQGPQAILNFAHAGAAAANSGSNIAKWLTILAAAPQGLLQIRSKHDRAMAKKHADERRRNPDAPCQGAKNDKIVASDEAEIAKGLGGTLETGLPYPGFKYGLKALINPNGQSLDKINDKLRDTGFSPFPNFNPEHYGGNDWYNQMPDGRYYHVTVGALDSWNPFASIYAPPPWLTIHCHGTNPMGPTHIIDYLNKH